ncbi:MAG: hypothetical protein JKY67_10180 [Pseudomonadales bacterium]|nr:hypothetical protein [Pseudomonadales bacterium]
MIPEDEARKKTGERPNGVVDLDAKRSMVPRSPNHEHELASLVAASKQIASMAEPTKLTPEELDAKKIIYPEMADHSVIDSFRELRTKLTQLARGENQITMITSVCPRGGSTHVALNLAAAFSLDESKTSLLIDCNLRNPGLHDRLYLDPEYGLTDFLEKEVVGIDSIIYATGIHRLRLIPVGRRREAASEFFTSLRMKAFLDVLKRRYPDRHIFVDAPPVGSSADARILSHLCDRSILVVPYGRVLESQVFSAVDALGEDKLAGVILNK